jgi:hypothetical protein
MAKVYARHINGSSAAPGQSVPAFGSLVASAIRQCNEVPLRRCGQGPRARTCRFNHGARHGPISVSEPRDCRTLAVRLHRKMLSAGVPPTRHHDPALSRQPGATRSPDRGLRYTHEGAERGAESDRSQALISINSLLWSPRGSFSLSWSRQKMEGL